MLSLNCHFTEPVRKPVDPEIHEIRPKVFDFHTNYMKKWKINSRPVKPL